MWHRLSAALVVVLTAAAASLIGAQPAAAVTANVTITATAGSNGTTTLTYRATATSSGTLKHILVTLPAGTGGQVTSVNGAVYTVSRGVLRWTPYRTTNVAVGARFAIPFYGLKIPAGGPWTLSFNAISTTGSKISSGTGVLAANVLLPPPAPSPVGVAVSNPIPGQVTNLTYTSTIARAGVLTSIRMQLPTGATGTMTSINGTLTVASGYATWTPRAPISVAVGARLGIPIYNVRLSRYGGEMSLAMTARTYSGTLLMTGTGKVSLIAPPAAMPAVAVTEIGPVPAGCPASWPTTVQENAKPGSGEWVIPAAMEGGVAAYLTKVSATCGTTVDLKVSSGKTVSVVAYRMGYYGGLGAREIWRRDGVPTVVQPPPTTGGTDSQGHSLLMVSAANWSRTLQIPIDSTWIPGTYLVKVSDGTSATYAPLTVRDDTGTKHDILIQQATTTWQAYNAWGGRSFYSSQGSGRLSFDRPYAEGQGSGQFLQLEQGLVYWAESKGLDVTYWTNNDFDEFGGQLPARAGSIFLPGHDEYYSMEMRAALSQAIGRGVNVGNLGANTVYRKISFTDSTRRTWDIDRYTAGRDSTTWLWLGDAYASQPLLGAEVNCWLYGNTLKTGDSWLFKGIELGTDIPGVVAGEIDSVHPNLFKPAGLEIVASSSGYCGSSGPSMPMHTTAFTAPSGARVFNASTFALGCYLVGRCSSTWTVPNPPAASQQAVGTMVANITEWVTRGAVTMPATIASDAAPSMKVTPPPMSVQIQKE